ncbi:MAG TPA: efflux RND transporter periplasmic adaptor subunit [Longimicrobiales bacterium]|nr:efflux RND transporter periplasmic adaptor subunit [Longimicrobiales bacterium]
MRRSVKWGIGLSVVGVIAVISIVNAARSERGVEVRIEDVQNRDLVSMVNASGWIRPNRKVDVQSDIMGRITRMHVKEGQLVKRGDTLLQIDPTQSRAAVERARGALSEAQARAAQTNANYVQAQRNADRMRQLASVDSGLVSRQDLEEAETQELVQKQLYDASQFGVAQARASLNEAIDRLGKTVLQAPMDGTITRLQVEEGETAIVGTMNNSGSLLLTVSDLSVMETVIRVDETDVPDIELGDSAEIRVDAFPRQTFRGVVTEISHSSVRPPESITAGTGAGGGQAVDFEVVIRLENPPSILRPDLSATADVITDRRTNAISIPIIALTVRDRGEVEALPQEDPAASVAAASAAGSNDVEGVFVVRDGIARFVPVTVGIAGREHFEIVAGLEVGDSVVAGPYEAIRSLMDGQAVRRLTESTTNGPLARNRTGS